MSKKKSKHIEKKQEHSSKQMEKNPSQKLKASKPVFEENYHLPDQYDSTSMTLIPRDPHWVYAYWDVNQTSWDDLKKRVGSDDAKHVIRVYDVSKDLAKGGNQAFDIDVGPYTKDWYINVTKDNGNYCADLGLLSPDGKFHALTHSNTVSTQSENIAHRSDMIWMNVKNKTKEAFVFAQPFEAKVHAQNKKGKGQEYIPEEEDSSVQTSLRKLRIRFNLTEDDIKNYYIQKFPLLSKVNIKRRKARALGVDLDESELESLFKTDAYFLKSGRMNLEQSFHGGLSLTDLYDKVFFGSSSENVKPGGRSSDLTSSHTLQSQPSRSFFFELKTELLVSGRTEPTAEVYWQNQKIELQPDGTFTLRLDLPESSTVPLQFTAKSQNRIDIRSIKTQVQRAENNYDI